MRRLLHVFGDDALGRTAVSKWVERFKTGRQSLEDNEHKGRPKASNDPLEKSLWGPRGPALAIQRGPCPPASLWGPRGPAPLQPKKKCHPTRDRRSQVEWHQEDRKHE